MTRPTDPEIAALRAKHYDATVAAVVEVHADLRILRIVPDAGPQRFEPGQYTTLGLGMWEPRTTGVDEERLSTEAETKLVRRAYSYSCPMLDDAGHLLPPSECPFLEFYVALVRTAPEGPPALTPRLFALRRGDRLDVGPKSTGRYLLRDVGPDDDVLLIGTGTGEAPHTAMTADLLHRGHAGRIACVTCVRLDRDLAYRATFATLAAKFPNFRYVPLTTRESRNLDPAAPDYVGRRHLQDVVRSGDLEHAAGFPLDPRRTHVFLCGNPAMIGAPVRTSAGAEGEPAPDGMIALLESRGFRRDRPDAPGNIHFETYW